MADKKQKKTTKVHKRQNLVDERLNRTYIDPITGEEKILTQKQLCIELSPKIKITSASISAIETGKNNPGHQLAEELCKFFGKPHAYLFHQNKGGALNDCSII